MAGWLQVREPSPTERRSEVSTRRIGTVQNRRFHTPAAQPAPSSFNETT
jgi:hypothetical protein